MERISLIVAQTPKLFLSFGAMWLMITSGNSLSTAKQYQLQIAEYKLSVGSALSEVKKVSDTLEQTAKNSPIALEQIRQIEELTIESDAVLEELEAEIEEETDKLLETKNNEADK